MEPRAAANCHDCPHSVPVWHDVLRYRHPVPVWHEALCYRPLPMAVTSPDEEVTGARADWITSEAAPASADAAGPTPPPGTCGPARFIPTHGSTAAPAAGAQLARWPGPARQGPSPTGVGLEPREHRQGCTAVSQDHAWVEQLLWQNALEVPLNGKSPLKGRSPLRREGVTGPSKNS